MKNKRKGEDEVDKSTTPVKHKKQRLDKARTIAVQFAVLESQAGPSKMTTSMEGLPSVIDVEKFAESRAFETNAMQKAMKTAADGSTHRVFQTLPRHLRRRAASHDVRRVPARLREKARSEMDGPKKNTKKQLPKRGKAIRVPRTQELLVRQVDKTWLETHLWHAKRMRMENMWGYRLAVTPTEKSFRPSHRASIHDCILHDASYYAIIELKGLEAHMKDVLTRCSDPQAASPGAARYIAGSRVCYTDFYKAGKFPMGLVGPIELLWRPRPEKEAAPAPKRSNGVVKQKEGQQGAVISQSTVWIRCHPLIFHDILDCMKESIRACVYAAQNKKEAVEIELADLRDQFNIFELVGPKSSQIIHGALTPVKDDKREEFKQFWASLGQVQTAGSVPRGIVAGLRVMDPRLNFPPKNTKITSKMGQTDASLPSGLWPTAKLAACDVWSEETRDGLKKPHFKKKDIDARKSKHLVPGSELNPLRQDDRVPVLLIQHSIEGRVGSTKHSSKRRALHGWTVMVPKGWGMPFFSSLTYTGTRVAGQAERETQYREAGCPFFPFDYPCTPSYEEVTSARERDEREKWGRKPPAKRPSWDKLGTRSPWKPDLDVVLGLKAASVEEKNLVPTQRTAEEARQDGSPTVQRWLLWGPGTQELVEEISHAMDAAYELRIKLNALRSKRSFPPLDAAPQSLLQSALVAVSLSLPKSGSPDYNAMLYQLTDNEAKEWHAHIAHDSNEQTEEELGRKDCSPDCIIGYVTSGGYSLSNGRGMAIGAMSLSAYLCLKEQSHRIGKANLLPLVKFRNPNDNLGRLIFVEVLG